MSYGPPPPHIPKWGKSDIPKWILEACRDIPLIWEEMWDEKMEKKQMEVMTMDFQWHCANVFWEAMKTHDKNARNNEEDG